MRPLLFLLALFFLAYGVYYYVGTYARVPVRTQLMLTPARSLHTVTIATDEDEALQLKQVEHGRWAVLRDERHLFDQSAKVSRFINLIWRIRSDSLVRAQRGARKGRQVGVTLEGSRVSERFNLEFPADADRPVLAHFDPSGNPALALPPSTRAWLKDYLNFDAYRERRLLDLDPASVDSVLVYKNDSLLWGVTAGDLRASSTTFIAPAAAPYADHFDEIAHQDRLYGSVRLYTGDEEKRVSIYRDSLWPRPFVLVGEDYPRRFLAYERLR